MSDPLRGHALQAPPNTRGFDTNSVVSQGAALAFAKRGYRFAVRYVRRTRMRENDLGVAEIYALHDAGLAVSVVQHVESESSWVPSPEKGHNYGRTAAQAVAELGMPSGVTIWLDLEGVAKSTPSSAVDHYCRNWYGQVHSAGYQPGLYVGWNPGLNAQQLYVLPFTLYWSSFNLNADQRPAHVGVCMKQGVAKPSDIPKDVTFEIDTDLVTGDALGRVPTMLAPEEWSV